MHGRELVEDTIRDEVDSAEEILWIGQPRQGIVFRWTDIFVIPFTLLWGGFAIFWEVGVLVAGAPWFFALWGIPFVAVGLYMIFGRFLVDARQRRRTIYAVTSERILIISGLVDRRIKSLALTTLADLSLTEHKNGAGSIAFGNIPPWQSWYGGTTWLGLWIDQIPCFELIDDSRSVYELIRTAQRAARSAH